MIIRIPTGISLLLLGLWILPNTLVAQHSFSIKLPGIKGAPMRPVVETPDGGFVLLFSRIVEGSEKEANSDDSTYCGLAKFSADGLVEWSRYVTIGAQKIWPISLLCTADGGYAAVAAVSGEWEESDIAFLHFDAHGYLLSAKRFDFSLVDGVNDAITTDDGSVLIAGYVLQPKEHQDDPDRSATILIRTDIEGEVLQSTLYPGTEEVWGETQLRDLGNGEIALIGSIEDSTLGGAAGLTAIIEQDGTIRETFAINPRNVFHERICTVTDLVPNSAGGFTLIGNTYMPICDGMLFTGIAFSLNSRRDTLWTEEYAPGGDVWMTRILSSEGKRLTFFGQRDMSGYRTENNPRFLFGALDQEGRFREGTSSTLYADKEKDRKEDRVWYNFSSSFLPTDDGGGIFTESVMALADFHAHYDARPSPVYYALLSRIAPDFSSCSGTSELVDIGNEADNSDTDRKTDNTDEMTGNADSTESEINEPVSTIDSEESEEERQEEEENMRWAEAERIRVEHLPAIIRPRITSRDITLNARTVIDHHTIDFTLEPEVICQENSLVGTSSARNESPDAEATAASLTLSPNSIRAGQSVGINFSLPGDERPDISLLTVATGKTVRQLESNAITWSQATGRGSAHIETAGLTPGIYLVRVRSGEKQHTAKLEVR